MEHETQMKITNKTGLPEAIVEAIRNDPYDAGDCDISVTQLVGPPQIRRLRQLHEDKIEEDASDRIWALLGQAVHTILERAGSAGIVEERLFAEVNGYTISGQLDRISYEPCRLTDYKVTSAWTFIGGPKADWISQLNCYAFLCRANGINVDELEIVALYRDWSWSRSKSSSSYPASQVAAIPVALWDQAFVDSYIRGRLSMHFKLGIVPCTDQERWAKPEQWAIMREGRKSALRVLESEQQALDWAEARGHLVDGAWQKRAYLQERPREYIRCQRYCPVSDFCRQWGAVTNDNNDD